MRVCGAWIRIFFVLCSKTYSKLGCLFWTPPPPPPPPPKWQPRRRKEQPQSQTVHPDKIKRKNERETEWKNSEGWKKSRMKRKQYRIHSRKKAGRWWHSKASWVEATKNCAAEKSDTRTQRKHGHWEIQTAETSAPSYQSMYKQMWTTNGPQLSVMQNHGLKKMVKKSWEEL